MDSMGLHSAFIVQEKIKNFYCQLYNQEQKEKEEKKENEKEDKRRIENKPIDIKYKSLYLPRQENARDCGVFIIYYLFYFLQSNEIIEYNNLTEWSKKCDFPRNSTFLRSYLMHLIHEIYVNRNNKKDKKERDENYKKNKKIINSLYNRDNLINPQLIDRLHNNCPLLPINGLIKRELTTVNGKDIKIDGINSKNKDEIKEKEKEKEKEKKIDNIIEEEYDDDEEEVSKEIMDILDGKTLSKEEEKGKEREERKEKSKKRKLDDKIEENEGGIMKKVYKKFKCSLDNILFTKPNPKHKTEPVIPENAANNIKKIIPKNIKQLDEDDDLNDIPPTKSLHDSEEIKNQIKNKDSDRKKRKKEKEDRNYSLGKKKQKMFERDVKLTKKTKIELDDVKTPTKKSK